MTDNDLATEMMFPIRELSARTQVNTVTIRAWERRYGLLKPQRTAKGHRLYSEDDVATIEKIIALVARGVPLGKVKPLLSKEVGETSLPDVADTWEAAVTELQAAVLCFSATKVERLISDAFANYPAPICRDRLIEPLFAELILRDDHGAALAFAESELLRYSAMRLNAKVASKCRSAVLIGGQQAPIWRLALMALELSDADFAVYLFYRSFTVATGIALTASFTDSYVIFYQDGLWNKKEQALIAAKLVKNNRLFVCGTAPSLSELNSQDRVFTDVKACVGGLVNV